MRAAAAFVVLCAGIAACTPGSAPPEGEIVPWQEAQRRLSEEGALVAGQAHSLWVSVTDCAGAEYHSRGPAIDVLHGVDIRRCPGEDNVLMWME